MAPSFAHTRMRRAEKGGPEQCQPTKLHAVVDTEGRPIYIAITPGQRHEMMKADELLDHAPGKALSRTPATTRTGSLYAKRYLVECFFHNLKRFRAIATRSLRSRVRG
jgi:transposase